MNRKQRRIQEAQKQTTTNASSKFMQAFTYHKAGQFIEAQKLYEEFIKVNPNHFDAIHLSGVLAAQMQDYPKALKRVGKAIDLAPEDAEAHYNYGNIFQELQQWDKASQNYERAIALKPDYAEAYFKNGVVLQNLKRFKASLANYDRAIALNSAHAEAYSNRGIVLRELKDMDAAFASLQCAIALNPHYAEAYSNRGILFQQLRQMDAALAQYDKAIELKPDFAEAYFNRGNVFKELNHVEGALNDYDKAIALNPDHATVYWNKSITHLLNGEYKKGWPLYEWRWKSGNITPRLFQRPLWSGQDLPEGSIILIHAEQGYGDVLQFSRYLSMIPAKYNVVFECYAPLMELMRYNFPHISVVETASDYPGTKNLPHHDYSTSLMSLPHIFATTLETIPQSPYLKAQPEYIQKWLPQFEQWKAEQADNLLVGLCWAGGHRPDSADWSEVDARRSLKFSQIKLLLDIKNASFISLQVGPSASDIDDVRLKNITAGLKNWSDTAVVIDRLDLVIAVDTAVCHLAAAMGKRTFLLNRYDTCWRWLLNRDDSPWYPSLTQFRQKTPGDWDEVIVRVTKELKSYQSVFNHSGLQ